MYRDHEFDPVTPEEQARREQEDGRIGEEVALLINPCFIEVQKRDVGAFVGIRDIVHKAGVDGIAAVRAAGIVEVDDAELRNYGRDKER